MLMALVKQSHHLIAISLQFPLYKQKIEDLVTIEIHFFIFVHGPFTHTHSIGSFDPIKKIMFRNSIILFFNIDPWIQITIMYIPPQICH
jgi:hypothetical protein